MLATVLVPPPSCAGTFPESTHEPVHGLLPPRRGVTNMNGALPRLVLCRIFWEGLELKRPALVIILKWWIGEKNHSGSLKTA